MFRKTDVFINTFRWVKKGGMRAANKEILFKKYHPPFREQLPFLLVFKNIRNITFKKLAQCIKIIP